MGQPAAAATGSTTVRLRFAAIAALLALTAAALLCQGCGGLGPAVSHAAVPRIEVQPVPTYRTPVRTVARSGDTVETVCRRLAGEDWVAWRDALVARLDPHQLRPGTSFDGVSDLGGTLAELEVVLDRRQGLHLVRDGALIRCQRLERPLDSEVLRLEGTVESSLFGAVERAGGNPDLAVRVAEIFQWDVDFLRDLRRGDRFIVVVDCDRVEGSFYRWGTIYAARFLNGTRTLDAFAYPDDGGRVGYYDREGRPLRKQFLRAPLKFSRITSTFSMRRFHPVLHQIMPHYGVDYGAPVGTPVLATADGVVSFVGSNEGAGRMVTLRHPNGFETNYLHLSGFAAGVRTGARVAQGQVIGFVGSSGLSTGPHLDYRVQLNGRWINPLVLASPPAEPLGQARLARFLAHARAVVALLEGRQPPRGAIC